MLYITSLNVCYCSIPFALCVIWKSSQGWRQTVRRCASGGGVLTSPLGGAQALAAPTHTTCSECVEPERAPSSRRGASQPCDLWLWLWLVPTSLYICFIVKPAVFFHKKNWKYYINYIYYFPNKSFNLYLLITFYNLCLRKTPFILIAFTL